MRRSPARLLLAASIVAGQLLLFAAAAAAADISSQGPLTRVIVGPDLTCQVAHVADEQFELFGGEFGSCGTFLAFGGNVYGPSLLSGTTIAYAPISQTPQTGSGSQGDPLRVTTVVEAPSTGVRIEQVDTYVVGTQSYRTDIRVTNDGTSPISGTLYRYGDCYLQNQDTGFGRVDNGAPACIVDPAVGQRIEQWTPLTPGSSYFEGYFGEGYGLISQQVAFPGRCDCNELVDNGAGLSWSVSIGAGQSATYSHETFFSPTGRAPATESYVGSVPDPTQLNTDPVVLATTAVIAAGVIVLVPFPSALFNSTLEENYDEVMGGVSRIRRRLQSWWRASVNWLRARVGNPPPPGAFQPPLQAAPTAYAEPMHPLGGPLPGQAPAPAGPEMAPRVTAMVQPDSVEAAHDVWRTPLGILGFVALSALLYAFLDPTFGLSLSSLATVFGLAIGLIVILAAYGAPLLLFSNRHRVGLDVRALPATLIVAVICVVVSRLVGFQPGYLYGLIVGFYFAHSVTREVEGKAEAYAAGSSLGAAFVAWVVLAFLRAFGQPGEFSTVLLQAATVTVVVAGLENAVFSMLPLRFMPGAAVFSWNKVVWGAVLGLGVFGFAYVLLNPGSGAGYLADTTRTSFFTMIVLLAGFGLASVVFWAWFRFRPDAQSRKGPAL